MAVKICEKCGESNKENATSCINCGGSLVNVKAVGVSDSQKALAPKVSRCPHCDKKIVGDAKKCPHCGSDLTASSNQFYTAHNSSYSGGNLGIYVLCFVIPLVGFIIGAINLASEDKKEEGGTEIALGIISIVICIIVRCMLVARMMA